MPTVKKNAGKSINESEREMMDGQRWGIGAREEAVQGREQQRLSVFVVSPSIL